MAMKVPFSSQVLWEFMQTLDSNDPALIYPFPNKSIRALRLVAALGVVTSTFQLYETKDVFDRVLLWRLPLLALWLTMVLPPFNLHTQIFALLHVISSPLDAMSSLMYLLDLVKDAIRQLRKDMLELLGHADHIEQSEREDLLNGQFLPLVARIVNAYDEWGFGVQARETIQFILTTTRLTSEQRKRFRVLCIRAATSIAADRKAGILPTIATTLIFLEQLSVAFWKTFSQAGDAYDEKSAVSAGLFRAPHNIAFGTLFFWLPLLVILVSLVGGPNTTFLVPTVLDDFQTDTHSFCCPLQCDGNGCDYSLPDITENPEARWLHGGLSVWQMQKYDDFRHSNTEHRTFFKKSMLISSLVVTIPAGCAMWVSWLTPTVGYGCRSMIQLSFWLSWHISLGFDWLFYYFLDAKTGYKATFVKDTVFFVMTVGTLTSTAIGVLNSATCWSQWAWNTNDRYISFVQEPYVFHLIKERLSSYFPALVGGTFVVESLLGLYIFFSYYDGFKILWQRDVTRPPRRRRRLSVAKSSSR